MRRPSHLVALVLIAVAVGAVASFAGQFRPGEWYEQLAKAPWTPPNWVFGPVWTVLYAAIAVAGWLVWRTAGAGSAAFAVWVAQLVANGLWSWLFFGERDMGLALADIGVLLALIVLFAVLARPHSRAAAWLFAPYGVWVAYASTLNGYAWLHN